MTTDHPTRTKTPISQTRSAPIPSRFSKSQIKLLAHVESARNKLQSLSPQELANGFNDLRVKTQSAQRDLESLSYQAMAFAKEATARVLGMDCLLYTSPSPRD